MARVTYVKKAQARFATVPVLDAEGNQKVIPVMGRNGEQKKTKSGRPVTRRLTTEDPTKPLPNRKCGKCGTEIKPGDPYKWVKPKSGPYGGTKRVRCATCPNWRPSELTSSAALSTLYAAQEAFEDDLAQADDVDSIQEALNALAEGVREAGGVYTESADNMEDGFGHETSMSAELREKGEALESAADEIENADLPEWDEDEVKSEVEDDVLQEYLAEIGMEADSLEEALAFVHDEDDEDDPQEFDLDVFNGRLEEAIEEKRQEFLEEARDAANDAADAANCL